MLCSVLRRWANPARTDANSRSGVTSGPTAGVGRRVISTSVDITFGRGRNTVGGTSPTSRAVAQYAIFTLSAPYAFDPGVAATNRSPTSRCTITKKRWISGTPSSRSATIGVATL